MLDAQNYGRHLVSYRAAIYGRKELQKPYIRRARDRRLVFVVLVCEIINSMSEIGQEFDQILWIKLKIECEREREREGNKRIGIEANINREIIDFHSS